MYTVASVKVVATEQYNLSDDMVKHFKAGANAAWSDRWTDTDGWHNLERAEDYYDEKYGNEAGAAFCFGWCWSASN